MHRKSREIPWGEIIAGTALFLTAVLVLAGVSWLGSPAPGLVAAKAWPETTATLMANSAKTVRPVWDGRHPAVWTGPMPLCPAWVYYQAVNPDEGPGGRRYGFARTDKHSPVFMVVCTPEGKKLFAWDAVPDGS